VNETFSFHNVPEREQKMASLQLSQKILFWLWCFSPVI